MGCPSCLAEEYAALQRDHECLIETCSSLAAENTRLKSYLDEFTGFFAPRGVCEPVEGYVEKPEYLMASVIELVEKTPSEPELRSAYHALADKYRAKLLIKGFGTTSVSDEDTWPT